MKKSTSSREFTIAEDEDSVSITAKDKDDVSMTTEDDDVHTIVGEVQD